jgi:hypothetical protein
LPQIAELIGLPAARVEACLGGMILDGKLGGSTLDAGAGTLRLHEAPPADVSGTQARRRVG